MFKGSYRTIKFLFASTTPDALRQQFRKCLDHNLSDWNRVYIVRKEAEEARRYV